MMRGFVSMMVVCGFLSCAGFLLIQKSHAAGASCGYNSHNDYICPGTVGAYPDDPFNTGANAPVTTDINGATSAIWASSSGVYVPPSPTTQPPTQDSITCGAGDAYTQFLEHLKLREGVRNCVYRDSLGFPTVGVGHLVKPADNLQVGDCITDAQVDAFLATDAAAAWSAAQNQAAQMATPPQPCFIVALGSVNFQLGTGWTSKFPRTWGYIRAGNYCQAITELSGSLWARQTPVRVRDFQDALREQAATEGHPC